VTDAARDWWEATADYFQDEADVAVGVDWGPGTDGDHGLLGDVAGRDAVELGCGGGQFGVGLAERGAEVVGVDLSAAQLAHARRLAADRGVDVSFVRGDVTATGLAAGAFDLAVSAMVLQWLPDVAPFAREAARLLRPGGVLAVSLPHPAYEVLDPETGALARSYFDDAPRVEREAGIDAEMRVYAHRVADVHGALRAAGFRVDRLLEPGSADPDDYDRLWNYRPELMARLPPTLVVRAVVPEEG
jgi:SAM-dependent methyltransferase